ncbi:hypothetical protein PtA15_15A58 [Puccinia triticina]|uniref:GH18 domain-containing protein n=1 Tax=Puccinia triticina TaxID=208348 RepID=A0ABY7D3H1_9BASI|nr:uncharacterized protein PtA15_15A58 [Puccinia triticina]WAQ91668.1 hypothetical protein PtA15_15A58 [Puccinia triticina]
MRSFSQVFSATFLLAALFFASTDAYAYDSRTASRPQVKGYYPSYNSDGQPVSKIDWTAYTDVLYFMVIPQPDFTLSYDPKLTKAQGDKLVTEFVAAARKHFSNLTSTDAARKRFAQLLVQFGKKHGFVGIEMDWEYPNGNLMAYDVYGAWAPTTGPLAPIRATCAPAAFGQSVETGVQIALKQGFKASQVILGIPGYAKRLELVSPKLVVQNVKGHLTEYYQNHTSVTPPGGQFDDKPGKDICGNAQKWGGSFLVNELVSNGWLTKDQKHGAGGYTRYYDLCSGQPFLTNGKYFITYDDQFSTVDKAKFAKQNALGGIYFFDTQGPAPETVRAARQALSN